MKLHVTKLQVTKLHVTIGAIAAALMFALVFPACETEYIDTYVPEAYLLSLKIGSLTMNTIPAPVDEISWNDDGFDISTAEARTIAFKYETDVQNARFEPSVSRGAKVKWGIASNRNDRPNDFSDTRVPATFDVQDFLYFQVTSEDGEKTNYYRFATYLSSPVKELASIAVAGFEGDMGLVAPDATWNGDGLTIGTLHVTSLKAQNAEINAVPWAVDTTSLRYAVSPRASTEPVFGNSNILSFADGEFLFVEVTAENAEQNIYCFRVYVGRIATIDKLKFKNPGKGEDGIFEALGKGVAKNNWADNTSTGSFESPHQPTEGFVFEVELDDPAGHWEYAKMDRVNSAQPTWIRPTSNTTTPTLRFNHEEYLAIKVIPENRQGGTPDYFYKVKVGLLAAEFTVQPKSHAYNVNESAEALTFVLDRTLTNPTYQWYEANSWYGGYGFDSVGRIGGKGEIIADPLFGTDDRGTIDGIDYNVSAWHVEQLDEKTNVSLHNGGNQYYRLPTPGRPIPGANTNTYTPPTTHHPFLAGFSSETHYYWVEVTAGNLKAVSKRAVIVTEWGQEWNLGQPSKDDNGDPILVNKKHHIIDLYAYQTPGAKGMQLSPRNPTPFKDGNHRDQYYIPVDFPPNFDIYDYSVFTAQALFFLADGRPWIQNWTQGDIGFAKDKIDEDGNLVPGEYEEIVLWYNLTNDNATRGLAGSGNEPQGGGLSEIPQYVVVKPAGTKPINQMPPFNADGTPLNNNNAQGWFTPYIELCEVRFEGPAREKPTAP